MMRILLWIGKYSTFHILINDIVLMIELIFPVKIIFLQMNPASCSEADMPDIGKNGKLLPIRRQIAVIFSRCTFM